MFYRKTLFGTQKYELQNVFVNPVTEIDSTFMITFIKMVGKCELYNNIVTRELFLDHFLISIALNIDFANWRARYMFQISQNFYLRFLTNSYKFMIITLCFCPELYFKFPKTSYYRNTSICVLELRILLCLFLSFDVFFYLHSVYQYFEELTE